MTRPTPTSVRMVEVCGTEPRKSFAAGDTVIEEGEPGGRIFILCSGSLRVMKGDIEVARIRAPGAIVGEMSVLLGKPSSATVVASEPTVLWAPEDSEAFLANPVVALHAARLLAQRLSDATGYLADLKSQFSDQAGHFGMIDRVLNALLNAERQETDRHQPPSDDPRL